MVLGFGCHQQMQVTPDHVKTACAMVLSPASFRFVGVTELWSDSIALFHAALGRHVATWVRPAKIGLLLDLI